MRSRGKNGGMNRREFIQRVGVTTALAPALVSGALAATTESALLGEQTLAKKRRRKGEPDPAEGALRMLSLVHASSGVPLGGIGAGSVELRPDGYFDDWFICNLGRWGGGQPEHEKGPEPEFNGSTLQFYVWSKTKSGVPQLRQLGLRGEHHEVYSLGYLKPVESIVYEGRIPLATLDYVDRSLPVHVSAVAFSPFTPHDEKTSGTPGFTISFTLENTSSEPVEVSLLGALANPIAWGAPDRSLHNVVSRQGATTYLDLSTGAEKGRKSSHGSMSLSVTGGDSSWIAGEYRAFLSQGDWVGTEGYGRTHESYLHSFREKGTLPSLKGYSAPDELLKCSEADIEAASDSVKQGWIDQLAQYAMFHDLLTRIERVAPGQIKTREGMTQFLKECRRRINEHAGEDRTHSRWGDAALCSSVTLAPHEKKEVRFAVSWYFPNHFSGLGPRMGHMYENWYRDAAAVNRFLVDHYSDHLTKALSFADTLFHTDLDLVLPVAWSTQLSTLVKCSWWTKDGRFGIWEGLGCCGFHTTDITYQGSFSIIALFPELQKAQMTMGASYQRADGRIPHFFTPDLLHVDNGFDRVDMNPQFVMLVCRDYLWTGDKEYLKHNWRNIVRAMKNTAELDGDGDGLPDHDTGRNTYDAWDFYGTPAYISSLWLGALRAAARMADDLGEKTQADEWRALLAKGAVNFEKKLWNGEYYSLWVDKDERDECCMSDQMSGEWYTSLMGIGHALPKAKVLDALKAVVTHNFNPEIGLLNATYPSYKPARFTTYRNGQAAANWTGIEFAMASMMLDLGMVDTGTEVVRAVIDRYARTGRNWNHVECGDHYYRAMCSWATLLAATGFKVDVPNGSLTVAPPKGVGALTAPWFSATAFGTLTRGSGGLTITCKSGSMSLRELKVAHAGKSASVSIDGKPVAATTRTEDGLMVLSLQEPVTLKAGGVLKVGA